LTNNRPLHSLLLHSIKRERKETDLNFGKRAANNCPLFGIHNPLEINNFSDGNGKKEPLKGPFLTTTDKIDVSNISQN
jgi:hypothetical protein